MGSIIQVYKPVKFDPRPQALRSSLIFTSSQSSISEMSTQVPTGLVAIESLGNPNNFFSPRINSPVPWDRGSSHLSFPFIMIWYLPVN